MTLAPEMREILAECARRRLRDEWLCRFRCRHSGSDYAVARRARDVETIRVLVRAIRETEASRG